jgi:hypothetical protein
MLEKDFLHNNWYIEITDENRRIVNDWKITTEYNNNLFDNLYYKYVNWCGVGYCVVGVGGGLITTEQFIKHVLKQPVEPPSYDYLIPILTKHNIK